MTIETRSRPSSKNRRRKAAGSKRRGPRSKTDAERGLSIAGRLGLAGRTGFYLILTGLTVRIAMFGGATGRQADAQGALSLVSRPWIGKLAIGAVALGFVLFGAGRLVGAFRDKSASRKNQVLTVLQGLFYLGLAYVPSSYLAGRRQTGSQQQQKHTTAELLRLPGGRLIVIGLGVVVLIVSAQQIRTALTRGFEEGLDTRGAPRPIPRVAEIGGIVGIIARALVFAPVGFFLIVSGAELDPNKSYGTDGELLRLSGYTWGLALLAAVALGLLIFVVYSAIETRYRRIVSAQ
jgi:hypothetical protein